MLNPIMELVFKANVGPRRVLEPGPELVGLIPESDAVLIPGLGSVRFQLSQATFLFQELVTH